MTDMRRKQYRLKELSEAGEVTADIATFGVKDRDGDITRDGFFGKGQTVAIVSGHEWGDLLLGKGVLFDGDGKGQFKGSLNLDDPDAAKLHSKLMFDMADGDPILDWSYGYEVLDGGETKGTEDGEPVNYLHARADGSPGVKVYEVSPVLVGAGVDTGTTAVKSRKFADHIESAIHAVTDAVGRAEAVAALRAEDGKTISADAQRQLAGLHDELGNLTSRVGDVLVATPEPDQPGGHDLGRELELLEAQYASIRQGTGEDLNE